LARRQLQVSALVETQQQILAALNARLAIGLAPIPCLTHRTVELAAGQPLGQQGLEERDVALSNLAIAVPKQDWLDGQVMRGGSHLPLYGTARRGTPVFAEQVAAL
jgi:hypothetical protein